MAINGVPTSVLMISVAKDFSEAPGGRYIKDGPYSGELFRTVIVEPRLREAILNGQKLIIDLEGTAGYATSFLEETFGGLVRTLHHPIKPYIEVVADNPVRVREVDSYIQDEEQKLS